MMISMRMSSTQNIAAAGIVARSTFLKTIIQCSLQVLPLMRHMTEELPHATSDIANNTCVRMVFLMNPSHGFMLFLIWHIQNQTLPIWNRQDQRVQAEVHKISIQMRKPVVRIPPIALVGGEAAMIAQVITMSTAPINHLVDQRKSLDSCVLLA